VGRNVEPQPTRIVAISPDDGSAIDLRNPALAAVLSWAVPGLGQLYKGQFIKAIVWFFLEGVGYLALILPGMLLHFFCIVGAASGNPWTPGRTEVVRR